MKAEHRKELQTNSLADMLGRTVRNVRGGTGISWTWILVGVTVAVMIVIFIWWRSNRARSESELWVKLDENTPTALQQLYKESGDTNQGKAALLTLAFEELYSGVRMLGAPQFQAQGKTFLDECQRLYATMEKECEGNDDWVAECKYGQAVATEALTVVDPANLKKAKDQYEQLAKGDLGNTGYGKLAARRLEQLNNIAEQTDIATFYRDFKTGALFQKAK